MKRKLLYTIVCLMLPMMMYGQLKSVMAVKPQLGVALGANFASLDGTNVDNVYKAGFVGGAYFGIRGRHLGGMVEALYNGSNFSLSSNIMRVNNLSVPVLGQLKLMPRVWFQTGPQYNIVLSVKDVNNALANSNTDPKDLFKSSSFSWLLGLWVDLPLHFNVAARYVLGLTDMNNGNAMATAAGFTGAWQQKSIQLQVGWHFL